MADEKSEEIVRLFKFDGDKANWLESSTTTFSLAKTKGFCLAYTKIQNCEMTLSTKP